MKQTDQILKTWNENSKSWIDIVHGGAIPSRKITNPAIINAITDHAEKSMLDVGCGEGWLSRELSKRGFKTFGLDATPTLIESAKMHANNNCVFEVLTFEEIISWSKNEFQSKFLTEVSTNPLSSAVFNFCLYEENGLKELLESVKKLIIPEGKIIIQTIHPSAMITMGLQYKSQWLDDAWKGLSGNFRNGHPWYFRTLENWIHEFRTVNLRIDQIYEPTGIEANEPSSIIFVLS